MPKDHKKSRRLVVKRDHILPQIHKPGKKEISPDKDWAKILRDRAKLAKPGGATAIGIHVVTSQLKTINASLAKNLRADAPPFGFGTLTESLDRPTELLECLYQVREFLLTLGFHLGLDNVTQLPAYVPFVAEPGGSSRGGPTYIELIDKAGDRAGEIALVGLVNRFSSAVFSDHHGLLLHAKIDGKPDLNIYYHSLDATHNFIGGTTVRSEGGLLPFTQPLPGDGVSLRGAVGFSEQFIKLMTGQPNINVIILAEVGMKEAAELVKDPLQKTTWKIQSNNAKGDSSGSNDITMFYRPWLESNYEFAVEKTDIGNSARIKWGAGDAEGVLLASHILNTKANNKTVGAFMSSNHISAIFGDTNMSTKASSSAPFKFRTVESTVSITDSLTLSSSNSASDKLFDKLLVRT